jgi:hypothetical protein
VHDSAEALDLLPRGAEQPLLHDGCAELRHIEVQLPHHRGQADTPLMTVLQTVSGQLAQAQGELLRGLAGTDVQRGWAELRALAVEVVLAELHGAQLQRTDSQVPRRIR